MLRDAFESHLRQNAERYFPEFQGMPIEITLTSEAPRISATLYRYQITAAGVAHKIIIKHRHPRPNIEKAAKDRRPLRYQIHDDEKYRLEANALRGIESYFTKLNDPRFGAIRVLDLLPEHQAIIMIEAQDPDLRRFFLQSNRLQALYQQQNLPLIFANAAAWLRHYHHFEKDESVQESHTTLADYIESIQTFSLYLSQHLGKEAYFQSVISKLSQAAEANLPEIIPTGRAHNDFTMRNILVGPNARVTVIDTLSKWQIPIYEDLAYFLLRLRTNQTQVYSQGLAYSETWLISCETAFLEGYFEDAPIPYACINLYQALALLDQWTSQVESLRYNRKGKLSRLRLALTNRHYQGILDRLLERK